MFLLPCLKTLFYVQFICRILSRYYQCQRQADLRNAARTTIRLLESLIRLAQAHARLMFREFVTVQDAIVAVTCVECSMQNSALLGSMNALHTRFPDEPQVEYSRQAKLVLKKLNLDDMVGAIDEVQPIEIDSNAGDSGNGAENNVLTRNANQDRNKEQSSSTDEENADRVDNDNNSTSNDFSEVVSPDQLTGVFPISSSAEVGTDDFIDGDSSSALVKSPSQSNVTKDIENLNKETFLKNPPTLRTVVNNNENGDSAKAVNRTANSLDKSKSIIQLFSKKPVAGVSATVTKNNCEAPPRDPRESSRIFMTEELDDEDLEMEWPTDALSSFQNERTVNHSSSSLRGSSEISLASNLIRFNSKEKR